MAKIIEISALCKSYQTQKRKQLLVFDNFNDYYALKDLLIRNFCILNSH